MPGTNPSVRGVGQTDDMHKRRLWCSEFWVDVRLRSFAGRWLASADTPDGASLGRGQTPTRALREALAPFDGAIDELLASAPHNWDAAEA